MAINQRYINNQVPMVYGSNYVPNWGTPNPQQTAQAASPGALSGIKGFFSRYFNPIGSAQPLFKGNVNLPSLRGIREQQLFEGGPSIGSTARAGLGLYQGGKAVSGLVDNSNKDADITSLKNDINTSDASILCTICT